jgi:hypothetical protein
MLPRPLVLYLDQSDLSNLALGESGAQAIARARLRAQVARGAVVLRVSEAHMIESAQLSVRRMGVIIKFLRDLPNTVFAQARPAEILAAEAMREPIDLRDRAFAPFALRESIAVGWTAAVVGPHANIWAKSHNQVKDLLRWFFKASTARATPLPRQRVADMPATALREDLLGAVERNLERRARRGDLLDALHLIYAVYADLATIDGFVHDVTKRARRDVPGGATWFRAGSIKELLDHIDQLPVGRRR